MNLPGWKTSRLHADCSMALTPSCLSHLCLSVFVRPKILMIPFLSEGALVSAKPVMSQAGQGSSPC